MIRILVTCLLLFTVGCASIPTKHSIDPVDLSLMNKIALVVLETKVKAVEEGFLLFDKRNFYKSPIQWYCRDSSPAGTPISKTVGSIGNVNVSLRAKIGFYGSSGICIDKKETEQLVGYFKDLDIKQKFLDKLTIRLKEVKQFEFLPRDIIVNLYSKVYGEIEDDAVNEDVDKFLKTEKTFNKELIKYTDADFFMIFYVGPWGFQRQLSFNPKERKGDFTFVVAGKIIRLNDGRVIWERTVTVDLSEGKKWKDLSDIRTIFTLPREDALIKIDDMVNQSIAIIIEDLKSS